MLGFSDGLRNLDGGIKFRGMGDEKLSLEHVRLAQWEDVPVAVSKRLSN